MKKSIRHYLCVLLSVMLVVSIVNVYGPQASAKASTTDKTPTSWILQWSGTDQDQALLNRSTVLRMQEKLNVTVLQPKPGIVLEDWLRAARASKYVKFIEPNQQVSMMRAPNDPHYKQQKYLKDIQIETAWDQVTQNTNITIGVVDTGVDLNHSDLRANLVNGANLINPGEPPQDDNGHGTSVAGVIGAVGNNRLGTSGILWNTKIMPIKALDQSGAGDEDKLGQGILYAVDHGAKIVVLSVGLYRYSSYLAQIVQYAEDHGVLLVAATGNDGALLGDKASVKYPAAYPDVLAVGGTQDLKSAEPRSNKGPEVDVVAPWHVTTTALGGGYTEDEGTSMAAPQAAGVAAMILAKYPNYKPYQIRNLIRQSAQDLGVTGWDAGTGYGLLRADRALLVKPKDDIYEENGGRDSAKPFPIDTSLTATLTGSDEDWYVVNAPYDGTLTLQTQLLHGASAMQVAYYYGSRADGIKKTNVKNGTLQLALKKGKTFIQLKLESSAASGITYNLSSRFIIYSDPYEVNNKQYQAYTLPSRSQQVVGTFHQTGDEDWYAFRVTGTGTLHLSLNSDTARIDPAMEISGPHMRTITVDSFGEDTASPEQVTLPELAAGQYYIRVYNAIASNASAVAGQYKLAIQFETHYTDPNEPNDKSYQAVTTRMDTDYLGVFDTKADADWFKFTLNKQSYVELSISSIPSNRIVTMEVLDSREKQQYTLSNSLGSTTLKSARALGAGTYLVKLTANQAFNTQFYQFRVYAKTLVAGFRDIDGHWAEQAITALTARKWIGGYDGYRFEPDRGITRAEAVSILSKAFQLPAGDKVHFTDVSTKHWAYPDIAKATKAGIVHGYQDGGFAPNRFVTRAEMVVMIGNAMKLKTDADTVRSAPFTDVSRTHWASPMLAKLVSEGKLKGYSDGSFKPERAASRAEFTAMLYDLLVK